MQGGFQEVGRSFWVGGRGGVGGVGIGIGIGIGGGGADDLLEEIGVAEAPTAALHLSELFQEGSAPLRFRRFVDFVKLVSQKRRYRLSRSIKMTRYRRRREEGKKTTTKTDEQITEKQKMGLETSSLRQFIVRFGFVLTEDFLVYVDLFCFVLVVTDGFLFLKTNNKLSYCSILQFRKQKIKKQEPEKKKYRK